MLNQDLQSKTHVTYLANNLLNPLENPNQILDNNIDEQKVSQSSFSQLKDDDPYITTFVCLLVPRFEDHYLVGDITDYLFRWMLDICVSFGWKLKFTDIKPDYLHWIMSVRITTSPAHFMKIICKETSAKIFEDFPRFRQQNMSKDFWAPLYFVGIGEVPYSPMVIQSFIKQIRIEQGVQ